MSQRKLYRTTLKVVVLSEDEPVTDSYDLEDLHEMTTDGPWSGDVTVEKTELLSPLAMARALEAQGSDPSFFQLEVPDDIDEGTLIHPKGDALTGRTTGGVRPCSLAGCQGARVGVRWADGRITFPCTHGMEKLADGSWRMK